MNGTLSQLVSLASAANGAIAGYIDPREFYPTHADFKFCNSVRFVAVKKKLLGGFREVERYPSPNEWLASLKQNALRAWLTFSEPHVNDAPSHQLAAFVGGGGDWKLIVATDRKAEYWMSRWDVTKQNASDNRIWGVTYGCVGTAGQATTAPQPDIAAAASRLFRALNATRDFALNHDLSSWAEWFQRAIQCFDGPITFPDYVDFVCPTSFSDAAQRLFAAAYNGWVFGGMGSWNDLYFETESDNSVYHDLSAELYAAINDGIQQATWAFDANKAA